MNAHIVTDKTFLGNDIFWWQWQNKIGDILDLSHTQVFRKTIRGKTYEVQHITDGTWFDQDIAVRDFIIQNMLKKFERIENEQDG